MDLILNFPGSLIVGLPVALLIGAFFGWLTVRK